MKETLTTIERELSAILPLSARGMGLLTKEGFIEYYLRLLHCCPTRLEAYERLEYHYTRITGRRRFAQYSVFKRCLNRYLHHTK